MVAGVLGGDAEDELLPVRGQGLGAEVGHLRDPSVTMVSPEVKSRWVDS